MRLIAFCFIVVVLGHSQIVLSGSTCDSSSASDCCEFVETRGNTAISRITTRGTQPGCTLSISPSSLGNRYRRFGFASDGQISIYVQEHAGSRGAASAGFLVYPAFENPSISSEGKNLILQIGSNQQWTFNSTNATPLEVEGCDFNVNSSFNLTNSGVNMAECSGKLVIPLPIEIGGEYIAYPNKPLTVLDPNSRSCQITTSDLYDHIERGANNTKDRAGRYYNLRLKYSDKVSIGNFFKSKCPNLDNSMFRDRTAFDEAFGDLSSPDLDE